MIITKSFLHGGTNYGCLRRKQADILGVRWPVQQGWMDRLEGKEISDEDAARFNELRKITKREQAQNAPLDEDMQFHFKSL